MKGLLAKETLFVNAFRVLTKDAAKLQRPKGKSWKSGDFSPEEMHAADKVIDEMQTCDGKLADAIITRLRELKEAK